MGQGTWRKRLQKLWHWSTLGSNRVKFFFLLLSVFLWFLINLSEEGYVSDLQFPVKYTGWSEDRILLNHPPEYIQVRLQANGFALLKYGWWSFKDLEVDLSGLNRDVQGRYYWLPNRNFRSLESQFKEETRILSISPDTVFFDLVPRQRKLLPVRAQVELPPQSILQVYGDLLIEPDSVWLSGPASSLEDLEFVTTKTWQLGVEEMRDSLARTLPLDLPDDADLSTESERVEVRVRLTRITEESLSVPIQVRQVPDSLQVEVLPAQVEVTYRLALRDLDKVQPENFKVYVDYRDFEANPSARYLSLQVAETPAVVKKVKLQPKRVEYIITRR